MVKCTIENQNNILKHDDMILIEGVFPKLVCLGLKFDNRKPKFQDSLWTTTTPKLRNVQTLELTNCHYVTFSVLCGFPSLRYLKLIDKITFHEIDTQCDDSSLHVRALFQDRASLYTSKQFWETFPNILLVT